MKLLVTGATGFLGTRLCSSLESAGHEVEHLNSRNCNLTRQGSLSAYLSQSFDQIIHLAAWTQAGDFCLRHPGEQWIINQQINTNVLQWWQESQPQAKLVFIGTSCAYSPDLPLSEENYLNGIPIDSLFTYAMTKRMLYVGAMALEKQYGLKYLCLVPSTLYGAGYHTDGRQMHFIFDLIRKILRGKYYGEPVELWGDGYQRRELVYVDDFVRLMMLLNGTVENDLINIGAGEEYTIREFTASICQIAGYDPADIIYDQTKYVGAKSKCLDVNKMRHLVPDYVATSLDEGLKLTIEWFQETNAYGESSI